MAQDNDKLFRMVVVILLLMCTFFLAGIWMSVSDCGAKFYPMTKKFMGTKMCPFTDKGSKAN